MRGIRDDAEQLRQAVMIGILIADSSKRATVEASEFTEPWASLVAAMKAGDAGQFDVALLRAVRVDRKNGTQAIEAIAAKVKDDAAWRDAESRDSFTAKVARVIDKIQQKRGEK